MWAAVCGCTPAVMLLPARLKRALACTRKLRTHLGRVIREIERQTEEPSVKLDKLLQTAHLIEEQQRQDKNRIYSVHEPEVECISKGKAGKQYRLDELSSYKSSYKKKATACAWSVSRRPSSRVWNWQDAMR